MTSTDSVDTCDSLLAVALELRPRRRRRPCTEGCLLGSSAPSVDALPGRAESVAGDDLPELMTLSLGLGDRLLAAVYEFRENDALPVLLGDRLGFAVGEGVGVARLLTFSRPDFEPGCCGKGSTSLSSTEEGERGPRRRGALGVQVELGGTGTVTTERKCS